MFVGAFREGTDGYYLWHGVDWESLVSRWAELGADNLRMVDIETFDSSCPSNCLNNVLMTDNPDTPWRDGYDYGITASQYHCEGSWDTCPASPAAGTYVTYSWPNLKVGSDYYMRNSVIFDATDRIFRLPFTETSSDMYHNGWLYSAGKWHHAIDYSKKGAVSFQVRAAATGRVIHIGWDNWSGNTMVISHDVGLKKDVYRTIHMHLRNGASNDCANAWALTVPTLTSDPDPTKDTLGNYKSYLASTGCTQNAATRNPQYAYWGNDSTEKINMALLGTVVNAGDPIARSGSTGPGGCGCATGTLQVNTHLHIFFSHRDPIDSRWYFFDPYGIYAYGDCYPAAVDAATTNSCNRYPVTWKNGVPAMV